MLERLSPLEMLGSRERILYVHQEDMNCGGTCGKRRLLGVELHLPKKAGVLTPSVLRLTDNQVIRVGPSQHDCYSLRGKYGSRDRSTERRREKAIAKETGLEQTLCQPSEGANSANTLISTSLPNYGQEISYLSQKMGVGG